MKMKNERWKKKEKNNKKEFNGMKMELQMEWPQDKCENHFLMNKPFVHEKRWRKDDDEDERMMLSQDEISHYPPGIKR